MTTALMLIKPPNYITIPRLKDLGYKLTGKQIGLGEKPYKYGILEVKNEDNTKEVGFCLLFSSRSLRGVILPHEYHFYELRPVRNIKAFIEEKGLGQ